MKRIPLLSMALVAVLACGKSDEKAAGGPAGGKGKLTIAVIPKGTTHEFWKSIHAGAVQASQELAAQGDTVDIIWKGPLREDDREQQVQVVEGFISQGVQGIVIAPLDKRALVRPIDEARRNGVPAVVIDSRLDSDSIVSFVATDNGQGGRLAADRIGDLLGGKGRVLLLRYQEGSASTMERETGFLEEMKAKYPGIDVISSDQYAGPTRETAKRTSENLLNRYGNDLQGIFTVNESSTIGMLLALQDIGKAGQIKLVGFDAGAALLDAVHKKQVQGLVVQDPMRMAYLGVKTMVDHLRGRPVESHVDTKVILVTPENVDAPEVKDVVTPPVARYLPNG